MIEDFKVSDKPTYRVITREVLACLAWGAIYPFGITKSKKRTPRKSTQRTVVFLHGYMANRASFFALSAYLQSLGIKQTLSFNYNAKHGIERAAKELRDFLKEKVRGGKIDFVCHSLGGVIAQVYVQELGGHRRVNRCISLGTPYKGTYNSYWVHSRVGRELRPDSGLMTRLAAAEKNFPKVQYTSIVGGSDNIVIPRVFATKHHDVLHMPETGHMGLLFHPTVFFEIAKRLRD